MKYFTHLRETAMQLKHQTSMFDLIFLANAVSGVGHDDPDEIYFIPLTRKIKSLMDTELYGLHFANYPDTVEGVIKGQKNKGTDISTAYQFGEMFLSYEASTSLIRQMNPSIFAVFILHGKDSVIHGGDLFSIPDSSGKRWFNLKRILEIHPDRTLEKYHNMFIQFKKKFMKNVLRDFTHTSLGYYSENPKETPRELINYMKIYVSGCELLFEKYMHDIVRYKETIKTSIKGSSNVDTFSEIILTDYVVQTCYLFYRDTDRRAVRMASYLRSQPFQTKLVPFDFKIHDPNIDDISHRVQDEITEHIKELNTKVRQLNK